MNDCNIPSPLRTGFLADGSVLLNCVASGSPRQSHNHKES